MSWQVDQRALGLQQHRSTCALAAAQPSQALKVRSAVPSVSDSMLHAESNAVAAFIGNINCTAKTGSKCNAAVGMLSTSMIAFHHRFFSAAVASAIQTSAVLSGCLLAGLHLPPAVASIHALNAAACGLFSRTRGRARLQMERHSRMSIRLGQHARSVCHAMPQRGAVLCSLVSNFLTLQ